MGLEMRIPLPARAVAFTLLAFAFSAGCSSATPEPATGTAGVATATETATVEVAPGKESAPPAETSAAKAAMTHMTRLMAADLAPKVRVNAIAVGSTATSALEIVLDDEATHQAMVAGTPLRRLGEPEDIALGALYLASPAASWVTKVIPFSDISRSIVAVASRFAASVASLSTRA